MGDATSVVVKDENICLRWCFHLQRNWGAYGRQSADRHVVRYRVFTGEHSVFSVSRAPVDDAILLRCVWCDELLL